MTVSRRRLLQSLALTGGYSTAAEGAEPVIALEVLRNVSAAHGANLSDDRLRVGADYAVTSNWTVGATLIYTASQYLRGDEANLAAPIPDYWLVNLNTKYRIGENFEIFAVVQNLFDKKYATFGTFAEVTGLTFGQTTLTDPRAVSPGPPLAAYAGIRVRF